jgi:hypothetical protein
VNDNWNIKNGDKKQQSLGMTLDGVNVREQKCGVALHLSLLLPSLLIATARNSIKDNAVFYWLNMASMAQIPQVS